MEVLYAPLDEAPLEWLFHYDSRMVDSSLAAATQKPILCHDEEGFVEIKLPSRRFSANESRRRSVQHFLENVVTRPAADIFVFPFLSSLFIDLLLNTARANGRWERAEGDDYSAPEMRLRTITPSLDKVFSEILSRHINPLIAEIFMNGYAINSMQPPFMIRYEMSSQRNMELHFDGESDLTLAVPLSSNFEGGGLEFPRQGYSSREVLPGYAVLFPGGPSHCHRALPIDQGERISLTIWTKNS